MSDDPIQKEIEANQARKRDTEDVGLDENQLQDDDNGGNFVTDIIDDIFNPEDSADGTDEKSHEFDDNTKAT